MIDTYIRVSLVPHVDHAVVSMNEGMQCNDGVAYMTRRAAIAMGTPMIQYHDD